jgi:hypothetical protein
MELQDRIVWIACEIVAIVFVVMAFAGWLPGGGV